MGITLTAAEQAEFDPVTATKQSLVEWYESTIGYDPIEEGWTIAEIRQTIAEYMEESR